MRVVLVGFGSVGRAFAAMLDERSGELARSYNLTPRLVGVIDSRGAAVAPAGGPLDVGKLMRTKQATGTVAESGNGFSDPGTAAAALIRSTQADVVVEASPSVLANPAPAIENLKAAMSTGKHAISVNKAPLAVAMPALTELAKFNRVQFRYSGTVGAGTPVLATGHALAGGDTITGVRAILNGTTNFILWRMLEKGDTYAGALAQAIELGYAETDPSADVDGVDTACKMVILANAVMGLGVTVADVQRAGIRDIERSTVEEAASKGQSIKLVGEIDGASKRVSVGPQGVARFGPMDVPESLNAVQFQLQRSGSVTITGGGAGGVNTATAILRDLVDIWRTVSR